MIYLAVIIAIAFGFLIGMIINDNRIIKLLKQNEMFKEAFAEVFNQLPEEIQLEYVKNNEDEKHLDKKV